MASEMSKDVKFSEEEVTSHPRVLEGEEQTVVAPARQSSIFALTLDELQYSVCEAGHNFGSMNMDEFMSNIWNAEEFQAATGGGLVGMEVAPVVGAGGGGGGGDAGGSNLARQESFSLPPPLCRKTVEEVWAEINREPRPVHAQPQAARPSQQPPVQPPVVANDRQGTLGEMTLEQFLVKAGVVRGSGTGVQAPMPVGMVHGQMNPVQQGQQPGPMMYPMAPANGIFQVMGDDMGFVPNGYAGMAVVPPPPPPQGGVGIVSPGSSDGRSAMTQADMMNCMGDVVMMENGGARKRGAPKDQSRERSIERRHRRMIKNRESAARSRARKQAYTVELEAELNHLKEENVRLKAEEKTILLTKKKMLVEQSKENVKAKKGGVLLRRCGSCISW
ncbi:bZIP transcription factor ABI5 homolog [Triticum dicoccoides]|uniref:bZIP transcription factor ABI5 homolog n=1 Tax=Triticum dicoccoides TaxID=85692 RepID=UPI00188EE99F|nr:bZIP transcription factor ABI5 homolog [Triticum dicoccoides]